MKIFRMLPLLLVVGCKSQATLQPPSPTTDHATLAPSPLVEPMDTQGPLLPNKQRSESEQRAFRESFGILDEQTIMTRLVGLSVEEGERLAQSQSKRLRVGSIDGEPFPLTADAPSDRFTVDVSGGKIVRVRKY